MFPRILTIKTFDQELKLKNLFFRAQPTHSPHQDSRPPRHRAPLIPATFDGKTLQFKQEVKRPAAGQSAVIYQGPACLGGGIICD